jgi:Tfp pilus assembly protein PilE
MRRALPLVAIAISLLTIGCGTKAQKHEDAQAIANLRAAIPSIEAYYQDHNSYAGATVAGLRKAYDPAIADIAIVKTDKQTYCIEATATGSRAFKNGPGAGIMLGSCSDPENGKPYTPPESSDEATASDPGMPLRSSIPAIEAYYQDHNSYAGMTLAKLRKSYDSGIAGISIVRASKDAYCIETVGGDTHLFYEGPAGPLMLGSCSDPTGGKPYESPQQIESGDKSNGPGSAESQLLRYAIPSIEAYYQDHNTYAGMTIAKLDRYALGIEGISIFSADKSSYCIEAPAGDPRLFFEGPAGEIMVGSCSDPENGTPYDSSSDGSSDETSETPSALSSLRASIPAIEAYWQDYGTYSGMTRSKLRQIDYGLPDIKIVSAKEKTYCIEITKDGERAFVRGPGGVIRNGTCPT